MNTPNPNGKTPATLAAKTMPTLGSIIGSAVGAAIAAGFKITDPVTVATVVTVVTAGTTALFHWVGNKIGVNLG
jgi:hypothetical protein